MGYCELHKKNFVKLFLSFFFSFLALTEYCVYNNVEKEGFGEKEEREARLLGK